MNGFPDVWAEGEEDDVDSSVSHLQPRHQTPDFAALALAPPHSSLSVLDHQSPLKPLLSISPHLRIAVFILGASIHTTPFLCLATLPPFRLLFSPPPGRLALFLALCTLKLMAFSSLLSPLLFSLPVFCV